MPEARMPISEAKAKRTWCPVVMGGEEGPVRSRAWQPINKCSEDLRDCKIVM